MVVLLVAQVLIERSRIVVIDSSADLQGKLPKKG